MSGLGDQAMYIQLINPATFDGQFLRGHIGVLIVRVGDVIVGVSQAAATNVKGDPPMPLTDFKTIASWLARSVQSLTGKP
jgi:hypothetical protein